MKIIIAGDGKVGATLTRQLTSEGYDVTVIDSSSLHWSPAWSAMT